MKLLFKILNFFSNRFPNVLNKIVYYILWFFFPKRKSIAQKNLEYMGFDKKLLKQHFKFLADHIVEFFKTLYISRDELSTKVIFKNKKNLDKYLQKGPVLFVTAHYGYWELAPLIISSEITKMDAIVRKLSNSKIDEIVEENRKKFGVDVIDRRDGLREVVKSIKKGKSIGVFIDQYPGDDKGMEVEFFKKRMRQIEVSAIISKKFNMPIVMTFIDKKGDKYIMDFVEIFYSDDIEISIKKQVKIIENYIKRDITKWYLIHKRFRPWVTYD